MTTAKGAGATLTPEKPAVRGRPKKAVNSALRELYIGTAAKEREPTIVAMDEIERAPSGPFRGRVYFAWMEHDPDGGCDRNPITDPHEDLAYVGKTVRGLAVRWAEHLVSKLNRDGEIKPNNSAVYRHRVHLTGWSADPRVYTTPEALAVAERRAIKALWPAWNIQEQDRRNPHSRASRSYRRPDRLAPLIGLASVMWGLFWAAMTTGLLYVAWAATAAWYWIIACPFLALYITNGTMIRHARRLAWRSRRRGRR
jgi:hypothetical protein